MTHSALNLSVVIITLNEEYNLSRCLASIPPGAEVIIVDSGSLDRTEEIACAFGASFFTHKFIDYASQKSFALSKATRPWILSLDADEELSLELQKNLPQFIESYPKNDSQIKYFRISRRLVFLGRALRYGKTSDHPLRLIYNPKAQAICFKGSVHEVLDTQNSKIEKLPVPGKLEHFSYATISDYFIKFNKYTDLVAIKHREAGKLSPPPLFISLRFFVEFIKRYVFLLGFLDGYEGYLYALFSSVYGLVKYAKLREIQAPKKTVGGR